MTGPFTIEPLAPDDAEGIATYVRIRCAVTPDNPDSPEQVRWESASYPGEVVRCLARGADGLPVGTASTGRIWMHGPEFERYWLGIWVLPEARRQGAGSALFRAMSDAARARGKTGFQTELSESHAEGHRFLAARGFIETERMKAVRLELAGRPAPSVEPPAGIRLVTLAERPDLLAGVHRVAVETFPDVPSGGEPLYAGTLDEFVARDVDRAGVPRDAFVIAVDEASGEVIGYANLIYVAGSTRVALHDMTAVRRSHRGRGIATVLKRATIAWAIANGLEALETGNDETNRPMRAVNLALGYRPIPDLVGLQGPLAPPR